MRSDVRSDPGTSDSGTGDSGTAVSGAPAEPGHRAGWLFAGGLLTVLVLLAASYLTWYVLAGSPPRYNAAQQRTYQHRIDRIEISLHSGYVRLTAGNSGEVGVNRYLVWSVRRPVAVERWDGDTLRIDSPTCAPRDDYCSVNYDVVVPAEVVAEVSLGGGEITTQDLAGDQRLSTGGGDIRVSGGKGHLVALSRGGPIMADRLASTSVDAETSGGDVQLRFNATPDGVTAVTEGGNVQVRVPRDTGGYRVIGGTSAGTSRIDIPDDPASKRTLRVRTGGGDVWVGYS